MTLINKITFALAIWGAILSTILGIQKFFLEKKRIKITFIELVWAADYKISIVNIGHRPITITDINLEISTQERKIPANARFKEEIGLPVTITDGGIPAEFILTDVLYDEIYYKHADLKITVYDAEGNTFSKYKREMYDEKYSSKEVQ